MGLACYCCIKIKKKRKQRQNAKDVESGFQQVTPETATTVGSHGTVALPPIYSPYVPPKYTQHPIH